MTQRSYQDYCLSCGVPVPPGQRYCSMCYGDPDYGADGYMRQLMERERKAKDLEKELEEAMMGEEEEEGARGVPVREADTHGQAGRATGEEGERMSPSVTDEPVVIEDPWIMSGAPCIRGTRIPVYVVLDYLAAGHSIADILADFSSLTEETIKAAIAWASQAITPHGEDERNADNR